MKHKGKSSQENYTKFVNEMFENTGYWMHTPICVFVFHMKRKQISLDIQVFTKLVMFERVPVFPFGFFVRDSTHGMIMLLFATKDTSAFDVD